ncbi:MAG: hypothetical protein V3V75_11185 [Thermoguttaceae bacterium]
MKKIIFLVYGVICYLSFLVAILYMISFVGDFRVSGLLGLEAPVAEVGEDARSAQAQGVSWYGLLSKTIDSGQATETLGTTLLTNVLLMLLLAVQHTIMARPAFKEKWTKIVPQPIERSTFVLVTSLILLLLFWKWLPLPPADLTVWDVGEGGLRWLLYGAFALGWVLVFYSSFLIDHFDLFGLRQVVLYWQGRERTALTFRTPGLYRWVRNPLMLGFLLAFWATPVMSGGHAFFALFMTAYIIVGIQFEERDIANALGEEYRQYRGRTSMIIPLPPKGG